MTSNKAVYSVSGRYLSRNIVWNLIGNIAPLMVAVVALPILIDNLGKERFGILTIAWMVVGYFSLFDLGIGRALTKLVSEKLGNEQQVQIPSLIWTGIFLMTALGSLGAGIVAFLSPWLVENIFNIPVALQRESLSSFYLLAASIPIVILAVGLRGILEAYQRFDRVAVVRIPVGLLTFLGPVAAISFSNSLVVLVAVLVVVRFLSLIAYALFCRLIEPSLFSGLDFDKTLAWQLLGFGGWMTLTNIIGPLMVYMDRFLIGAMISMAAVAYYATPYEIITKLLIIPGALMGVMFPAFSSSFAQNGTRTAHLFDRTVTVIFLVLFPITLITVTFAHEGLVLWIGKEFADNSSFVLKMLAVGVFLNSHAQVPFGLVQGAGRPDLTAKLHLIELPIYLALLFFLLGRYGISGAAVAWMLRMAGDALFLYLMADKLIVEKQLFTQKTIAITALALSLIGLGCITSGIVMKFLFIILVLAIYASIAWLILLSSEEKLIICGKLRKCFLLLQ